MRYIVKWNNGYWKIFDTHLYKDVDMVDLQKVALDMAQFANEDNGAK